MTKSMVQLKIPYTQNLYIDLDDNIWSTDPSTINLIKRNDLKIIEGKDIFINVKFTFRHTKTKVELCWLKYLAMYHTKLPAGMEERIFDIEFTPCSKKLHFFGIQMVFKRSIVFNVHHFIIPGFVSHAIDKDGNVIDCDTLQPVNKTVSDIFKYPTIKVQYPYHKSPSVVGIHKLMALTFIKNSSPLEKPVVNHKNGDKNDYSLKNLEWCSFQENNLHAINAGLRDDNVSIKVKDYETGAITVYGSLRQASDRLPITLRLEKNDISTSEKPVFIAGRYEIKNIADMSPWNYDTSESRIRYKIKFTVRDGDKEIVCYGIKDFADRFNLKIGHDSVTEWVDEFESKYPNLTLDYFDSQPKGPYIAINVSTKEKHTGDTLEEVAKKIGVSKSAAIKYVAKPKALIKNIWHIQEKSKPLPDESFYIKSSNQPKQIVATKNGEERVFSSFRECSREIGADKKIIKKHIESGRALRGYSLAYR